MKRLFGISILALLLLVLTTSVSWSRERNVRLLYWNIQNGMWADQGNNYDNFVDFVKSQNPDICVWCEAATIYYNDTRDKMKEGKYLPDNWAEVAARYGHRYVYLSAWRDDYPQVITSRYRIRNVKRIIGSKEDVIVCHGASWTKIRVAGKTMNFVTMHTWPHKFEYHTPNKDSSALAHGGDKYRRREMEYICNETISHARNTDREYWLMLGDFNSISRVDNFHYLKPSDSPEFLVHDYISGNTPYIDLLAGKHPGEFIRTHFWGRRIDYVYGTQPVFDHVKQIRVLEEGWSAPERHPVVTKFGTPSDHIPILVDFVF